MKSSFVTVTDLFCGAGGSSLGAINAGADVWIAANHWEKAIKTHAANFPSVEHDLTDLAGANPARYRPTTVLIASPECTNHSGSKGVKRVALTQTSFFDDTPLDPAAVRSRATMLDVVKFVSHHQYQAVIIENVAEVAKWEHYATWLDEMCKAGNYLYKEVYFNSQFAHPTPQSRDRIYVVFWKKGNKAPDLEFYPKAHCPKCNKDIFAVQSWKKPTFKWGKYGNNRQYIYLCPECVTKVRPYYYCAANIIDWSLPITRIGDNKKGLKPKTIERIQAGLEKFGKQPIIMGVAGSQGQQVERPLTDPFPTQTGTRTMAMAVPPFLVDTAYTHSNTDRTYGLNEVLRTQTARQDKGLVVPPFIMGNYTPGTHKGLDEALGTVTTVDHNSLVVPPFILEFKNNMDASPLTGPLSTVLAGASHHYLLQPFITSYYGSGDNAPITDPLGTVPTRDRHALVYPGDLPKVEDCYFRMLHWKEIQKAMAFPDDYKLVGTSKDKVKLLGNAVTPPVMDMLLKRVLATFG